ncbi:gamma-gliadin-like [Salvia hispanica]|uniref:gamma-gliadin-like n=1 Tax=Salvia hispanica TaxID=49212 RepID=UPI002008F53A|nr:gamma-gliadin-like [Salvia hispanica]
MAKVNLRSWLEISQATDGLQLNPAVVEYILAKLSQFETRLDGLKHRASTTHPSLQPEPDPPDTATLYTAAQLPYQSPLSPHHPATTFQQSHAAQLAQQYLQPQQPYQPPAPPLDALQWQQPQQPEMQDWRWQQHQPHTRRQTSWDPPSYRQQSGLMPYDQYPLLYHHRWPYP